MQRVCGRGELSCGPGLKRMGYGMKLRLLRLLRPANKPYRSERLRRKYGMAGGIAGIVVNFLIFLVELLVGSLTGSLAVSADAFHNLTDVASSCITIVSFQMAAKPPDKRHPFGHGRMEYLSPVIVSFVIMIIGYEFLKSSVLRVIHPAAVTFSAISLGLVLMSIPFKVALSLFNHRLGKAVGSTALRALSFDALGDVFVLCVASLSLVLSPFTKVPVDGWLGILVALFIMYSGFAIARNAFDQLIGLPPDRQTVSDISNGLLRFKNITGVHDIVVHNYGPGRLMASAHAEVPDDLPVTKLHDTIDRAEKYIERKYGILIVLHMDPLNNKDEHVRQARAALNEAVRNIKCIRSVHDFRLVGEGDKKNLIFDVVVDSATIKTAADEYRLKADINRALHRTNPQFDAVVSVDKSYD